MEGERYKSLLGIVGMKWGKVEKAVWVAQVGTAEDRGAKRVIYNKQRFFVEYWN